MKQLKITKKVTNRDAESLNKYLHDISRYDLISPEKEAELALLIKEGNLDALNELIRANLRFVISVSKQYQGQGLSLSDLISEGNIGLMKAARRFDATKGFKFISYAVWWIRQSILQAIAEHARIVRLPLNKLGSINKVNQVFNELYQKYEREPTYSEIAKELDFAPNEIKKLMQNSAKAVSMDAPVVGDEDTTLYDILKTDSSATDKKLLKESLTKEILRVLGSLPSREAEIIKLYYGLSNEGVQTLEEIGERFNLTRERVRQVKGRTIKTLRRRSAILKKYL